MTPDLNRPPTRVLVIDDHELFRLGLATMLAGRRLDVVGTAATGEEGVELAERLQPDVVLMDLSLPGIDGIDATARITSRGSRIGVVLLSAMSTDGEVIEALLAGASSSLLKSAPIDEVVACVEATARGESVLDPRLTGVLLRRVRARLGQPEAARPRLSERESAVLGLLVEGRDNAEIARTLLISQSTVKAHVSSILDKLGAENRVQAAVRAVRGWWMS
jgi:two-component system, NarL family, response regulator LiaR